MVNIRFGAGALGAGAGAASRCGSGYTKMMQLIAAPATAPQHIQISHTFLYLCINH
jgi:hypothetical protein